ncbi:MAG: AAC(3) family N-acetyltransferase [Helicobacteraceae bacterium]|nr:AAC(3) family N-acetyltransferase [Helicobacteraceae bacterium]
MLKAGQKASFETYISEELHREFAFICGDVSALHTSSQFAESSRFKKRLGYTALLHSLLSRLYGEYLPGGKSICMKQSAVYKAPYYIGDTLVARAEAIAVWEATQTALIKTTILKGDLLIMEGEGLVKIEIDEDELPCLYKSGARKIRSSDLVAALDFIKEGDAVFTHSDISSFGALGTTDRAWFFDALIASFIKVVGLSGNLLFPVFTYSFCKNEPFDVQNTPSCVGVLTEAFRKQKGVVRNLHPIFSVAGRGALIEDFLTANNDSFGEASVFANLVKNDAWILLFGTGLNSLTFIHHIEQSYTVPYRYMKRFEGSIINLGAQYDSYADYYVRDLNKNPLLDTQKLEKRLLQEGVLRVSKLGDGYIKGVKARELYDIGISMLKEDIRSFIKIGN